MSLRSLPILLSPNLGCPEILSPDALNESGLTVLLAVSAGDKNGAAGLELQAKPLADGDGTAFSLVCTSVEPMRDDSLPPFLMDVAETRRMVNTFVRTKVLRDHAFYAATFKPAAGHAVHLRPHARPLLYDLVLTRNGEALGCAYHALCLRRPCGEVRFVHLTDLHVAARNDLWAQEIEPLVKGAVGKDFNNFNDRLRAFIKLANRAADEGQLDFVLALGDLVDFVRAGVAEQFPGDNNWSTLVEILIGSESERRRGNSGLRVPLFTTTGNHDWRTYPYGPEVCAKELGIDKKTAEELDQWYHDTSKEVGKKILEVHGYLIREGSPLLQRSWWGTVAGSGIRGLEVGINRLAHRAAAVVPYARELAAALSVSTASVLGTGWLTSPFFKWAVAGVCILSAIVAVVAHFAKAALYQRLRAVIENLIAIESGAEGLTDYFLKLNPFFNYAFRLEDSYFLVMDTGHDCLTAESFWDEGAKKIRRITIRDNILGGSPDSMGFFPPNENYPYGQIAWMEQVLDRIQKDHGGQLAAEPRRCRVFVAIHAPVANLSESDQKRVEKLGAGKSVFLEPPSGWFDSEGFNACYGCANHYLSEFFYLCLGYREGETDKMQGVGVDAVFSGHAHWNIEFKLEKPGKKASTVSGQAQPWNPEMYYGDFSKGVESSGSPAGAWWGPLLLQTAACGPPSDTAPDTPYYRYVTVDASQNVRSLRARTLKDAPV